ncbi:uncharacterized protein HMPREF1541_08870 [Cyphellophora europaea CBS 101466]|uniref:Uncharacterized protein n=1 Tax=Cyphellophora europaea (strain CBS 101466) TaxID=1220924 RepID=W2RJC2_CYPE1|nr:uncharacterized protein HMPREF1541_08870 [Cyphellophora europaea CBS 101466]ETN36592.1 hypothetical protein HMPREF1541_08870 [Cyphellophora europaea CBS 101466]
MLLVCAVHSVSRLAMVFRKVCARVSAGRVRRGQTAMAESCSPEMTVPGKQPVQACCTPLVREQCMEP